MDEDLPAALARDLDGSFERLVLAFQGRLFGFALRQLGNRQDAEEVVQDAFVRAYRALRGYPPERIRALAPRAWLYQITLNLARNQRRGRRPRIVSLDADDETTPGATNEPAASDDAGPEASAERADTAGVLAAGIAALPPRYRTALILRHVEGLSYREVATVLDQPLGTAKANVHRGVRLLRQRLAETELDRD